MGGTRACSTAAPRSWKKSDYRDTLILLLPTTQNSSVSAVYYLRHVVTILLLYLRHRKVRPFISYFRGPRYLFI